MATKLEVTQKEIKDVKEATMGKTGKASDLFDLKEEILKLEAENSDLKRRQTMAATNGGTVGQTPDYQRPRADLKTAEQAGLVVSYVDSALASSPDRLISPKKAKETELTLHEVDQLGDALQGVDEFDTEEQLKKQQQLLAGAIKGFVTNVSRRESEKNHKKLNEEEIAEIEDIVKSQLT